MLHDLKPNTKQLHLQKHLQLLVKSATRLEKYLENTVQKKYFEHIQKILNKQQNSDFENIEVSNGDDEWDRMKKKTGHFTVPMIFIGDESYFMESSKAGEFEFVIPKPSEDIEFHIESNDVTSHDYELKVVVVPSIANFEMLLNFPGYLNKKSELIKGLSEVHKLNKLGQL